METSTVQAPRNFAEAQEVLAAALPGYVRRTHQMALAEIAEEVINGGQHGIFQAGTGIGKSLVALITAILSGERTVIATATKALQAQYTSKDLPFLEEHLGVDFTWAVVKGRANYPCHVRTGELASPTAAQQAVVARVKELSTAQAVLDREVCDREDFPALTEEDWRPFSMSADECPGASSCPFGDVCLAERAKAKAAESQIVITNTAYLLRDLALRETSGGNVALLGEIGRIVIDEGHTLPEAATSALEDTLGEGSIIKLARDMAAHMDREDLDVLLAEGIEPTVSALWSTVTLRYTDWVADKNHGKQDPMPLAWKDLMLGEFAPYFTALYQAIDAAREEIKSKRPGDDKREAMKRERLLRRSAKMMARIEAYTADSEEETVRWAEMETKVTRSGRTQRLFLCSAPVSVGPFLRRALWDFAPTVLMSATLAAGDDFSFMEKRVGLGRDEARRYNAGSPFDYQKQAVLFVPDRDRPDPKADNAAWRAFAQAATRYLVTESGGGALLLFTSRSAMNEAYQVMADDFRGAGLHVMKQGESTTSELVRMMKEDGNAVLFALRTFFEGIDIQGSALRLVVIDKLPFTPPTDLVHQAREQALIRETGDRFAGFSKMAVPEMSLVLTQAFGRLIRSITDLGVVAILDPRLTSKQYGREIVKKLPPARKTTDPRDAAAFLHRAREVAGA